MFNNPNKPNKINKPCYWMATSSAEESVKHFLGFAKCLPAKYFAWYSTIPSTAAKVCMVHQLTNSLLYSSPALNRYKPNQLKCQLESVLNFITASYNLVENNNYYFIFLLLGVSVVPVRLVMPGQLVTAHCPAWQIPHRPLRKAVKPYVLSDVPTLLHLTPEDTSFTCRVG